MTQYVVDVVPSCFVYLLGKEYVCVVRLHDAIASETKLAQVSVIWIQNSQFNFFLGGYQLFVEASF